MHFFDSSNAEPDTPLRGVLLFIEFLLHGKSVRCMYLKKNAKERRNTFGKNLYNFVILLFQMYL